MAASNVLTLTGANFDPSVVKASAPVLVDFWASWCGPCKMLAPAIDDLALEYAGKVVVGKVDIDAEQDLAVKFNIQSIPTLLFFKNGQVAAQLMGLRGKPEIKRVLDQLLAP
jgi:thioredoxin 1